MKLSNPWLVTQKLVGLSNVVSKRSTSIEEEPGHILGGPSLTRHSLGNQSWSCILKPVGAAVPCQAATDRSAFRMLPFHPTASSARRIVLTPSLLLPLLNLAGDVLWVEQTPASSLRPGSCSCWLAAVSDDLSAVMEPCSLPQYPCSTLEALTMINLWVARQRIPPQRRSCVRCFPMMLRCQGLCNCHVTLKSHSYQIPSQIRFFWSWLFKLLANA